MSGRGAAAGHSPERNAREASRLRELGAEGPSGLSLEWERRRLGLGGLHGLQPGHEPFVLAERDLPLGAAPRELVDEGARFPLAPRGAQIDRRAEKLGMLLDDRTGETPEGRAKRRDALLA